MAQDAQNTITQVPMGWKSFQSFEDIQGFRIDFKQALVELVLGLTECARYFQAVKTRAQQAKVMKLLLGRIGNKEAWRQEYINREEQLRNYRRETYVEGSSSFTGLTSSPEELWQAHIDQLRQKFQIIKHYYERTKRDRQTLGIAVQDPTLSSQFSSLFGEKDLAKYILLFEPNFPEDMMDIPGSCKRPLSVDMLDSSNNKYQTEMIGLTFNWTEELPNLDGFIFRQELESTIFPDISGEVALKTPEQPAPNLPLLPGVMLSPRYHSVIDLLAKFPGKEFTYEQLGETLSMSDKTARNYVSEIINALGQDCPINKCKGGALYKA